MSIDPIAITLLIGTFILLIICRVHIAFSMGIATFITTLYIGVPMETLAQNLVSGINSFAFMAVPFFILAGEIMSAGGISKRLIALSNALVGWMRGGLAMVNILASMFFGGISGSATADTSSLGSILIPMMKKDGYDGDFATTVTMASSVQGLLIPPSHNMVIYALVVGGVSLGRLFLAGIIPGIVLGIALMIFSYIISIKRNYPVAEKFSIKKALKAVQSSILGLGTVIIIVFGVITGIFTATESAAIAVIYSFIVTFFIYREIPLSEFKGILTRCIQTLCVVMILIAVAKAFGWVIAYLRIPAAIANILLNLTTNRYIILLIINLLLLVLATMMGMSSIILIITPILIPVLQQIGVDFVHFGVVMILNLGIGLITPPVGGVLFIGSAIANISIEKLSKSMIPFYLVMVSVLMLITYIPGIVMFLPNLFMPLK